MNPIFTFKFISNDKVCFECYDAYSEQYAIKKFQADYGNIKFDLV